MPQFQIRLAELDDVPSLESVERSAAKAFSVFPDDALNDAIVPEKLLIEMATGKKLWVAVDDVGQPIGFAACRDMDDILYIHEISVAYEFQKQGIGGELMRTILSEAALAGYSAVGLTTRKDVPWYTSFYKTLGFREIAASECPALWVQLQHEISNGANPSTRCAMLSRLKTQ